MTKPIDTPTYPPIQRWVPERIYHRWRNRWAWTFGALLVSVALNVAGVWSWGLR